jgi:hypothetical protein
MRKDMDKNTRPLMPIHMIRTTSLTGSNARIWIGVVKGAVTHGKRGESMQNLARRICAQYGVPAGKARIIEFGGVMRPSEAAITIVDLKDKELAKRAEVDRDSTVQNV